jgi:hypothetical protein
MTAIVTSAVVWVPPRSHVRMPWRIVAAIATRTRLPRSGRPRWSSSMAPPPIAQAGSIPSPAISGAEPLTGLEHALQAAVRVEVGHRGRGEAAGSASQVRQDFPVRSTRRLRRVPAGAARSGRPSRRRVRCRSRRQGMSGPRARNGGRVAQAELARQPRGKAALWLLPVAHGATGHRGQPGRRGEARLSQRGACRTPLERGRGGRAWILDGDASLQRPQRARNCTMCCIHPRYSSEGGPQEPSEARARRGRGCRS